MINKGVAIWKSFLRSELLINTTVLISGTVLAQLIPILLRTFLTRHYTPETFGAFAVYLSLIGIFIVISSFKYELAIVLPRKDSNAANVLILSILLSAIFNIILLLIILIWDSAILEFLNLSPKFSSYLYFVPLGTFLFSIYQSINYWLIRKKKFYAISLNKFTRRGFEGGVQFGFAFTKYTKGLVLGDIIGQFANVAFGVYQGLKSGLSENLISWERIKYVLKKYFEFPKFNLIPGLMSACSFYLPAIFINKYYSSDYTGYIDLSKLLLSIPLALVATSLSSVLLQRLSEKFRNNLSLKRDLISILGIISSIVIVEILVITFFGVELFTFIFGDKWEYSGRISKILVWSYALNFLVASYSSVFISMNKIKLLSIWQLFYFVSILMLFFFRNRAFDDFIKIYVFVEVVCYIVNSIMIFLIVKRYEKNLCLNSMLKR